MHKLFKILGVFGLVIIVTSSHEDQLVDPASRTIQRFKYRHQEPIGVLSTSSGQPVEERSTNTFTDANLLMNSYFFDSLQHLVNEKIPERTVNPKGAGAHGYFEVLHDVTMYTKAKLFEKVGKITPVFARFGAGINDKGGTDASLITFRTISFKMYTEEGNLDFLSLQTPIFDLRSPALFLPAVHAANRRNPKSNLDDRTAFFDFINLHPQSIHWLLWSASEFGLPRGYRYMNVYPIHTFGLYNTRGEIFYVRFKFLSELGFQGLSLEEAQNITATDADFFSRDLYNSIDIKDYPSWSVEMDVITEKQTLDASFNPFDVISIWPNGTYQTVPIGRIVFNKNPENYYRDVELSAFNPANLVPGILEPVDSLYKGRVIAYFDTQVHRLGVNHNKIQINCPLHANTYNRDGLLPILLNMKDSPTYYPNSFNGPQPYIDDMRPIPRIIPNEEDIINFEQPRLFYRDVLTTDAQKKRLVDCLVQRIIRVVHPVQQRFAELLTNVDGDLAKRFRVTLAFAKKTNKLPAFVTDLIKRDENLLV